MKNPAPGIPVGLAHPCDPSPLHRHVGRPRTPQTAGEYSEEVEAHLDRSASHRRLKEAILRRLNGALVEAQGAASALGTAVACTASEIKRISELIGQAEAIRDELLELGDHDG